MPVYSWITLTQDPGSQQFEGNKMMVTEVRCSGYPVKSNVFRTA